MNDAGVAKILRHAHAQGAPMMKITPRLNSLRIKQQCHSRQTQFSFCYNLGGSGWCGERYGTVQSPMGESSGGPTAMSDVTRILGQIESGDPTAARESCRWSTTNCASWPLRRWPRRSLGRRCRPQRSCTRPICNWWGTRRTSIGTTGAISLCSGRGDAAHLLDHWRKGRRETGADWDRLTLEAIAVPGGVDPSEFMALNDLFDQ